VGFFPAAFGKFYSLARFSGERKMFAVPLMLAAFLPGTLFASELAIDALPEPHTRQRFRNEMPRHIRADHPAILPVAAAIRAVTTQPIEQLVMVNDVTHLLVDFDDDERVYGKFEYHATLDEMLANRRQHGWLYLRDDCDGRAVFAAHLLAALGIPFRLEASYWKRHAWVVARVNGVDYDLLDLSGGEPEVNRPAYRYFGHLFTRASNPPPLFNWRRHWAERTQHDLTIGLELGMLTIDSRPGNLHERYLTDWVRRSPGGSSSPFDDRTLTARCAGFPYGEGLQISGITAAAPSNPSPGSGSSGPSATSSTAVSAAPVRARR
jgi:hypothetical protein